MTSVDLVSENKNFNHKNFFYTSVTEVEKMSGVNVDRKTFILSLLKSFPRHHGRLNSRLPDIFFARWVPQSQGADLETV